MKKIGSGSGASIPEKRSKEGKNLFFRLNGALQNVDADTDVLVDELVDEFELLRNSKALVQSLSSDVIELHEKYDIMLEKIQSNSNDLSNVRHDLKSELSVLTMRHNDLELKQKEDAKMLHSLAMDTRAQLAFIETKHDKLALDFEKDGTRTFRRFQDAEAKINQLLELTNILAKRIADVESKAGVQIGEAGRDLPRTQKEE